MQQLETCINHLRVCRMAYVADCDLVHRNCDGLNQNCDNYTPYTPQNYVAPVKKGSLAYTLAVIRGEIK